MIEETRDIHKKVCGNCKWAIETSLYNLVFCHVQIKFKYAGDDEAEICPLFINKYESDEE